MKTVSQYNYVEHTIYIYITYTFYTIMVADDTTLRGFIS